MILDIISTLIALLLYNGIKKIIKIIFIKKNKNNLQDLLNSATKVFPIDTDFWEDK